MKNIKKLSFIVIVTLVLVGGFVSSVPKVLAAAGGGTATIAVDGGTQGSGVTVVQSTSHVFTTVLTVGTSGMTLGASSPTFTIPTGFTAPHANGGTAVPANAGQVDVDGEWFAIAAGGGCTVAMSSSGASGQVITIDVTADCAAGHTITLTYKGTPAIAMGSTALEVRTADGAPAAALIASSPTITVTDVSATPTPTSTLTPTPTPTTSPDSTSTPTSTPTSTSTSSSSTSTPVCVDSAPTNNPDIFQIDRAGSKAILYFTPVNDYLSYYYIAYGLSPGDEQYGVSFPAGLSTEVVSYTINDLNPNLTYYFKVRGGNGCAPGGWSNNKESNLKNPGLPNTGFAPHENNIPWIPAGILAGISVLLVLIQRKHRFSSGN